MTRVPDAWVHHRFPHWVEVPGKMARLRIYDNGYIGTEEFPEYIDHYLYFPERSDAERAAVLLREREWKAEVQPAALGSGWLALATQPATGEEEMGDIYEALSAFAKFFNGKYDGWERPMTEDDDDVN